MSSGYSRTSTAYVAYNSVDQSLVLFFYCYTIISATMNQFSLLDQSDQSSEILADGD